MFVMNMMIINGKYRLATWEDKMTEENLAKAVGGRLVKIKAEYEITEKDGSDLKEPEVNDEEDEFKDFLSRLLKRGLE